MFRGLILLSNFFLLSCATHSLNRNISSISSSHSLNEGMYLEGVNTYFQENSSSQTITLVNKYNTEVQYKITVSGGIALTEEKGTCGSKNSEYQFYKLPALSTCTFSITKLSHLEHNEGEIKIFKQNNNNLAINEIIYLNTFSENQCDALVINAYKTLDPENLHKHQLRYDKLSGGYIHRPVFIKQCKLLQSSNINSHNKVELFNYCISKHSPQKKKFFISPESGEFDLRLYQNHLNELSNFDPESYCGDIN